MKKILTSYVAPGAAQPVKSGTLIHLQSAYSEAIDALGRARIGKNYDPTKVYILYGCVNSGAGSNYIISAGAVFYNGEVYLVDAATFTISTGVAVGKITTTYFAASNADPVEFTDGGSHNVHQINKIVISEDLSGSGAADYVNFVDQNYIVAGAIGEFKYWKVPGTFSTYFDVTGLGIHPYVLGWAIANGNNGTDDYGGKIPVPYKNGDSDFGTIGATGGAKTHTLAANEQGTIVAKVKNDDITGGGNTVVAVMNFNGVDVPNDGAPNQGGYGTPITVPLTAAANAHSILNPFKVTVFMQKIA